MCNSENIRSISSEVVDDISDDRQPEEELIKNNLVDVVHPEPKKRRGEYWGFRIVGDGKVTNSYCGKFMKYKGCLNVHAHNKVSLDGVDYSGKIFGKPFFSSCDKHSCPICFKRGWAVREAGRIEERLKVASKHFGIVEHLVASVPPKDYHLSYTSLRRKTASLLKKLGVIGGVIIFHGFRYRPIKGWFWSPHFHVIGFILGGYSRCRKCKRKNNCDSACDGFDSKRWKLYQKCKWYVKVFGKRKTVFGTAWYQLNHSTYDSTVKNFHIATWFGVCSYRKMKITREKRKELCPICGSELKRIMFIGESVGDFGNKEFFDSYLDENGNVRWLEVIETVKVWCSGSQRIREDDFLSLRERDVDFEHYIDDCLVREVNV